MDNYNIAQLLRDNANKHPNKNALTYPEEGTPGYQHLSYQAVDKLSDTQAYAMQQAGISRGDKVVFMVKPGPEMFTLIFALYKIGALPILVDPGMGIKRMLHCYQSVGASAFLGMPLAVAVKKVCRKTFASINTTISVKDGAIVGQADLLQGVDTQRAYPICHASENDLLHIGFTTGSTGPAKAVESTHGMAQAMRNIIARRYHYTEHDIELVTIPFMGLLSMIMGHVCVLPRMNVTKPAEIDPVEIMAAINQHKATTMTASPALLNVLGEHAKSHPFVLQSMRLVSSGGAPITRATMQSFTAVLPQDALFETVWGATEGLPLTGMNIRDALADIQAESNAGKGNCIGEAVAGVDISIIPITNDAIEQLSKDDLLANGEIGEIMVSGANVSPSYHQNPEANRQYKVSYQNKTWHRTGDLGYVDEQQRVWFCGRKAHTLTLENSDKPLYSVQCEGVANQHPSVYRSALVKADIRADNGTVTEQAVMCVQLSEPAPRAQMEQQQQSILDLLKNTPLTQDIHQVIFHPDFPVDIRHNAKIDREQLGLYASQILSKQPKATGFSAERSDLDPNPIMIIPILGWLYIAVGIIWPFDHWALLAIWWIDVFLSVVVHLMQVPVAYKIAKVRGFSKAANFIYTFIFGATWWKKL